MANFRRRFWFKEHRHSGTISDEKRCLYPSTRHIEIKQSGEYSDERQALI